MTKKHTWEEEFTDKFMHQVGGAMFGKPHTLKDVYAFIAKVEQEAKREMLEEMEALKTGHKLGEREICIECIDRIKSKLTQ